MHCVLWSVPQGLAGVAQKAGILFPKDESQLEPTNRLSDFDYFNSIMQNMDLKEARGLIFA